MEANGLPNCFLSNVYCKALCQQSSAAPITPQDIPYLALFRQLKGPFKPSTFGNIFSSGTKTLSITISPVIEARNESFLFIFGALKPFIPFSRINPFIFFSCLSDFAHTIKTSAIGELEIHIFDPDNSYPPSTFLAVVFIPPGSDPASGSVKPKQPIKSPLASFGKNFCFCSSLPKAFIGCITKDD